MINLVDSTGTIHNFLLARFLITLNARKPVPIPEKVLEIPRKVALVLDRKAKRRTQGFFLPAVKERGVS